MILEPLYTAAEMRVAEERYPGYPQSAGELMERAGRALAEEAVRAFPHARRFAVVCGSGSNGGDGRVAVAALREAGLEADETEDLDGADVVIDALFGTGFRGEPRPEAAELIERMNGVGVPVVACDLPSGVNASTGEVEGAAVRAALTVTFHGRKVGLVVAPGRFHAGRVVVADIGLEPAVTAAVRATPDLLSLVPRRRAEDTKYTAGTVLVVGGSPGTSGAAVLAASAALRADAGYVTLAVPSDSLPVVEGLTLEPVKIGFEWDSALDTILGAAERAGAVALGPGLGRAEPALSLVRALLERLELPVVVDADALYALEPFRRSAPTVLTPHAGELGRLIGESSVAVNEHRLEAVARCAGTFDAVCLLKGADTIVAAPDAGPIVCDHGPPSLATAGTGDVLTGIVAALLAKGVEPRLAAATAATAHGLAAASVGHQAGLVAGDVVAALPAVFS
jgi:NAD(P)H-hydrate epimerase